MKPGWWISVNQSDTDNYIKFGFKIKGTSGELKASVIADYLTHRELSILETERADYFQQRQEITAKIDQLSADKSKKKKTAKGEADQEE